ncbi:MAG: AAA family ATPase [Candidatus Kapaibacteriota bacterium]
MAKSSSKKASKSEQFDPREPLPADAPYFYSLTLENIRCFADKQTLDLSDGNGNAARWTVILGENGTGKTTILQSLARLDPERVDSDTEHIRYRPKSQKDVNKIEVIRNAALSAITSPPKQNNVKAKLGGFSSATVQNHSHYTGLAFTAFNINNRVFLQGDKIDQEQPWADNFTLFGFGAKRLIGSSPWEEYRLTDSTTSLFYTNAELVNVAEWLRNVKLAASMSPQPNIHSKRFEKIESLLTGGLLPQVDAMRLAVVETGIFGVEVTFHTPDGWIPLESLGLGYQTMIAWTVDFAARMVERYPHSPQPLHEPAIVLVDELDLHLHPRWQREIIGFLTKQFPKTQFIVTAHSPLVVQAAQDVNANIVLLRREGDHVVIDQNVRIDRNLTADQLLTSDVFGLTTLYSPETEQKLAEQATILSKPTLTATDKKRVKELESEIGVIPTAQSQEDRDAMALIRRAAILMEKNGMTSKEGSPKAKTKRKVSNGTH